MAKVSYLTLKRGAKPVIERSFTDKNNPGVTLELRLKQLGTTQVVAAEDRANEKVVEYVTGYGVKGKKGYVPPKLFPPIDGEPVTFSFSSARIAAIIEAAQAPEDEDDRYSFEEIIGLMSVDSFCEGLAELIEELVPVEKDEDKGDGEDRPLGQTPQDAP